MATLVFAAAGSALGGAIGGTFLGIGAAAIGQAVGASLGQVVDNALFGAGLGTTRREGPRLDDLSVTTSTEGAGLPDLWGRNAVAGQIIWAAKLREDVDTDTQKVGSGKKSGRVKTTEYSYFASFALSLGEAATGIGRIWLDGNPFDPSDMIAEGRLRFYDGAEDQLPDAMIAAIEGEAPAYRGTAYLVFEDLPVGDFGNRIPQVKVEVYGQSGAVEALARGVCVIPGSTEWGYDPEPARAIEINDAGDVISEQPLNNARYDRATDWSVSMDTLGAALPAVDTVSLVVAWFGTDLRAGECRIEPRVEHRGRNTRPVWKAGGFANWAEPFGGDGADLARAVSRTSGGSPAYGSSPSDASVVRAIQDLRARGKRVVLYPFVMMDIPGDAGLPDPSGSGTQPAYPWRGRIQPAAGQDIAAEIDAFVGGAQGFRAFILHLAGLADQAGGVDGFLIGSEMRGLTFATDAPGSYPFVDALVDLAADVRAILPGAQIGYAADWSEYHSHRNGAEVFFHLDPLWSSPDVDFIGIDNYLPLSDWRPGSDHLDYDPEGATSPYDLDYLKGNIEGGEYWDFYYADDADRAAQVRSPITPGPDAWVYRQKAIRDWHGHSHRNRPEGVEDAAATAWVPGSKPVWFTEIGCPAVTFGPNQPNVFAARLSSESAVPYFSDGVRDDFQQRQYLRAMLEWWGEHGGGVVDPGNIQIWCWDARPFPEFPLAWSLWSDGPDWELGHWLNGRAGAAPLAEVAAGRAGRHGLTAADLDLSRAWGQATGYAITGPTGFRDALQPFEVVIGAAPVETGGRLVIETRAAPRALPEIAETDLAETTGDLFTITRAAIEDVASGAVLWFRDGLGDYSVAAAPAHIGAGGEDGLAQAETPLVLDFGPGQAAAERMLRSALASRERVALRLPRSLDGVRPGVVVPITLGGIRTEWLVERIVDGEAREVEATAYDAGAWGPVGGALRPGRALPVIGSRAVILTLLDLPILTDRPSVAEWDGYVAAAAQPWPGTVATVRALTETGSGEALALDAPATVGELTADLGPGRPWTWDEGSARVRLWRGALKSKSRDDVLSGANALAVEHGPGDWEILQFATATLVGGNEWQIADLIRGARGTEALCRGTAPAGARVVVLDLAVTPADLARGDVGRAFWFRYGPAADDLATYQAKAHSFRGLGRRPFAPANLTATADDLGGVAIAWQRRSRLAVDTLAADGIDPPLGEVSERYRVEIGPAGAPLRSFTTSAPAASWSAAEITADGASGLVEIRVAQLSETFGPGVWSETTVEV